MLDTGASISVLPRSTYSQQPVRATAVTAETASGAALPLYGSRCLTLQLNGSFFEHEFYVADVSTPIIGVDMLRKFGLAVYPSRPFLRAAHQPTRASTSRPTLGSRPLFSVPTPKSARSVGINLINGLKQEFADVFARKFANKEPIHGVEHNIEVNCQPFSCRPRRLSPEKLRDVKEEFLKMEQLGIVRRSSSPWGSPLHCVKKPDGSYRPCGDYRRLNAATKKDRYTLPLLRDFTANLSGMKVFSTLDLVKAYFQVKVHKDSVPLTAIITPFGSWEFLRLPFGVTNAVPTFQRLVDCIFSGMTCVFVYIDDILIFSPDEETHRRDLRAVLQRLREAGLQVNPDKCSFFKKTVDFLGHRVSEKGIEPLPKHTEAISLFPPPKNKPQLQRFLGLCNFYRQFLPDAAGILRPLTMLLKKDQDWLWGHGQQDAFEIIKRKLTSTVVLSHYVQGSPLRLTTDASDLGIGGALEQLQNDVWVPLGFFSRHYSDPEENYATFDKELLACFASVLHFRHLLDGVRFQLRSDHKPVVQALIKRGEPLNQRQARQLAFLSEFDLEMVYLPGKDNVVADALSRRTVGLVPSPTTVPPRDEFVAEQKQCVVTQDLCSSTVLHVVPEEDGLLCDRSRGGRRVLVPDSLKERVLHAVHGLHHPGVRATRRLATRDYVWKSMAADVAKYVKSCDACARSKIQTHLRPPPARYPENIRRFEVIHADLVGPLEQVKGFGYLLTVVDRSTRCVGLRRFP